MKFRNVTREQLIQAMDCVSAMHYNRNLGWNRWPEKKGNAFVATLRVSDSHLRGARMTASGRHSVGASWHAHRDFFRTLLTIAPDCIIDTGLYGAVRYAGLEDFEAKHPATYYVNVGSQMKPARLGDLSVL